MTPASKESLQIHRSAGGPQLDLSSQAALLTNGRYTVQLNGAGGGFSEFRDAAVTRGSGDCASSADGFHLYLRDLDENLTWSAGYQPTRIAASQYDFNCYSDLAEIFRVDQDIECRLAVCVSQQDFEIRHCQLKNSGRTRRRLELTSYLEWVAHSTQDVRELEPIVGSIA